MYSFKYFFITVFAVMFSISSHAQTDSSASIKVSAACGMCKMRIEKALKIKGISKAKYDVKSQTLSVIYDPKTITIMDIHNKVAEVGHDTELKKADDAVYKALPDCCHYRELGIEEEEEHDGATDDENSINGMIVSTDKKGNFSPLAGASVHWLGANSGTTTNNHGIFLIPLNDKSKKLVISYTGFRTDTLHVTNNNDLQIVMAEAGSLKEVTVTSRQKSTIVNTKSAIRVSTITSRELLKTNSAAGFIRKLYPINCRKSSRSTWTCYTTGIEQHCRSMGRKHSINKRNRFCGKWI